MIPDCHRNELPKFLKDQGYSIGAEIGTYKGEYTARFCKAGLSMYTIDPWMAFEGQTKGGEAQERQDFLYGHTKRVLEKYLENGQCQILRETSAEAVKWFRPGELDFVYIDGDHSFPHVAHDIYEWSKIVKKGGIVAGHDYYNIGLRSRNLCHVGVVVDAYAKLAGLEKWWIFGWEDEDAPKKGRRLSWMWFKERNG